MKLTLLLTTFIFINLAYGQTSVEVSKEETVKPISEQSAPKTAIAPLYAEPIKAANESNIYDLMYMPAKGTLGGRTYFISTFSQAEIQYLSREYAKLENDTKALGQDIFYTPGENQLIALELKYQLASDTETKYGIASTLNGSTIKDKTDKGIEEPSILFKQRIYNQELNSGRNIDLGLRFSPKLGNAKSSNTVDKGNGLRGSSKVDLLGEIGFKDTATAWSVAFSFDYTGKSETEDATNSANRIVGDSYGVLRGTFTYQWTISSALIFNLSAGVAFTGERVLTNNFAGYKNEIEDTTEFAIGPMLIFKINPKLVAEVGVVGTASSDFRVTQTNAATLAKTNLEYSEASSGAVYLGSRYEF